MKKPIAILANDIHLNKDNINLVNDIFVQIFDLCDKLNISSVIVGGDVFTNRSGQPLSCLTAWKNIVDLFQEKEIELIVIPGNHDKTDSSDQKSYLDIYSNCCLCRKAEYRKIENVNFLLIPYFDEETWLQEWKEKNEDFSKKKPNILITHMGFDGVRNNDGSIVSSKIKPSMFFDYTNVLIGHYHNASKLANNVFYTGSVYQNNFGENINDKGFTIIYNDGSFSFVASKFPKYIKETILINDHKNLQTLIEKYKNDNINHIRFIFVGKKAECEKINISEIENLGIDCKFISSEEKEAIDISESDNVLYYDKKAIIKDYFNFCSENQIKGKEMAYGLKLIKNI